MSTSLSIGDIDIPELNLIYCGYLFFGRPFAPDTLAVGETDPLLVASALVASARFSLEVAEPALDGALTTREDQVSPTVVDWAQTAFKLEARFTDRRLDLLAQVIQSDRLATSVNTGDWPWSANGLASACLSISASPSVILADPEQIARIARGVHDVIVIDTAEQAVAIGQNSTQEMLAVEFALDTSIDASPFYRLDFGFLPKSENPLGTLYLDYGTGFSDPILLLPQGRARYAAFVSAAGLKTVRWQPDHNSFNGRITMLTARPISQGDIQAQLLTVAGEESLQWLLDVQLQLRQNADSGELAFELSNRLTMNLGGHGGCVASAMPDYDYWVQAEVILPKAQTSPTALAARVARRIRTHWRASSIRSYLAKTYHLARRFLARVSA